jgi:hypothetical protein
MGFILTSIEKNYSYIDFFVTGRTRVPVLSRMVVAKKSFMVLELLATYEALLFVDQLPMTVPWPPLQCK